MSVHPFEVGSHTGYISRENKDRLKKLHKFCKKDIKLKQLKNNISAIAVLSSYYIFNNRNIESWHTPSDYIMSPLMNMCNMWKYLFIQSRNQNIPAERSVNQHITLSMRFSYYFVEFCNPNNKVDIIFGKSILFCKYLRNESLDLHKIIRGRQLHYLVS